jgi:hypothetical protein
MEIFPRLDRCRCWSPARDDGRARRKADRCAKVQAKHGVFKEILIGRGGAAMGHAHISRRFVVRRRTLRAIVRLVSDKRFLTVSEMETFTQLEKAALDDVCLRFPDHREALRAQLATARVRSRENTGAGFYTRFEVARGNPISGDRMRAAGWTCIDGLDHPVGFILWLTDGYAECLEGFTIDDRTTGLDFASARFTAPFASDRD